MEEKNIYPDAKTDQENETAPIDIASLPLLHMYEEKGGLLFLTDEVVQELEENEVIQSARVDQERERFSDEDTQPLTKPQVPQGQPAPKMSILVPALILLVNLSIILAVCISTFFQTVTITIVPKTQTFTTHLTLSPLHRRIFSPITLTYTKTVPATGHIHQDARAARGTLTFYNALQQSQYIPSGTLVTSRNGVTIVTAQEATIPAGDGLTNGSAQVPAQATDPGLQGNIPAYALNGTCCREYILVRNTSAFTGGQNARDYRTVTQADITGVVTSLLPPLTQTISLSFQKQILPAETLTPSQCSQTISSNHHAGNEASTVMVTVRKTCLAGAYTTKSLQAQVIKALAQQAAQTVGEGYKLSSYLQTSPLTARIQHGTLVIDANFQGQVIYHFSSQELHTISTRIAGKNKAQALQLLQRMPGVAKLVLRLSGSQTSIPTDTEYIHIQVIEGKV